MTPEHVLQDDEGGLGVGQVDARREAIRRDLLGRRDDGIGPAVLQALPHQIEEMFYVVAALRLAGRAAVGLVALIEGGHHIADHPVPGLSQDC
jgi:hypothetical protein